MKGEWCYFKSYFDKATCEEIIALGKTLPMQKAGLGTGNNQTSDDTVRRSNVRFINSFDWKFKSLFNDLWDTARRANDDFFDIHISRLDFIQLAEYDASYRGEYKEHHDVFWLNDDPKYHRKLTCVVQLSDPSDYEGGDLELTEATHPPSPGEFRPQGSVIFFPSFIRHRALPVTKGTRYSLAAWFEGPKWR